MPASIVILMRKPFYAGKELLSDAGQRAYGVPYDGSSPMHFVTPAKDLVFMKAGPYVLTLLHHWGAYLGRTEEDTETGALQLRDDQRHNWREQKAWIALDLQNKDVPEREAMSVLAALALQIMDERCCGFVTPGSGCFFPNDGRGEAELLRLHKQ